MKKINLNFRRYSDGALLVLLQVIIAALTSNNVTPFEVSIGIYERNGDWMFFCCKHSLRIDLDYTKRKAT